MKRRRSFWKYLEVLARATIIADIRKKRIAREYQESWMRENRAFLRKLDMENAKRIYNDHRYNNSPSADGNSAVGFSVDGHCDGGF